jgi:regulator of replication initiation timing
MAVPSTSGDVAFNPDVATKQDVLDAISGTMQAIETMESKIGSLTDMVSQMPGQQATPALDVSELRHILDDMASKVTAPATAGFPDAVKDQMRDQWYQMAAQIEATRNSLSEVIAQNISRLEAQVHSASPMNGVAKIIEQQTGIMTELVSTMGILDAHMQAIRAQVSAIGRRAS